MKEIVNLGSNNINDMPYCVVLNILTNNVNDTYESTWKCYDIVHDNKYETNGVFMKETNKYVTMWLFEQTIINPDDTSYC